MVNPQLRLGSSLLFHFGMTRRIGLCDHTYCTGFNNGHGHDSIVSTTVAIVTMVLIIM